MTLPFREKLAGHRMIAAYTPADCTDVVAPVDHHVGARVKMIIGKYFDAEMELHLAEWESANLSASCRRMLMTTWVLAAWRKVRTEDDFLRKAFVSTGFLLAKDRSEDDLIKLAGCIIAYAW